jgi:hypothetical protein
MILAAKFDKIWRRGTLQTPELFRNAMDKSMRRQKIETPTVHISMQERLAIINGDINVQVAC